MRNSFLFPFVTLTAIIFTVALAANAQPTYPLFTVNSTADAVDTNPGDGICADSENRCTLRAAVQEANAASAHIPVIAFSLSYPAVINLTLGEININTNGTYYYFVGPGARLLTVQRSPNAKGMFRVFNVTSDSPPQFFKQVRMRGLTIKNGMGGSQFPGGGIRVGLGVLLSLSKATLTGNTSEFGGAAAVEGNTSFPSHTALALLQVLVVSNSASKGGAVYVSAGSQLATVNTTITNNSAPDGGAIYSSGTTQLLNSTFSHNSATLSASSILNTTGNPDVRVFNSIIANDTSLPVTALAGTFLSDGNNIITDARGSSGFVNGVKSDQVSDSNGIDPGLGPLADNGGPTDSRTLVAGSPAIDAGNGCIFTGCPVSSPPASYSFDQRVHNRVSVGLAPDIGAVEADGLAMLAEFQLRRQAPLSLPRTLYYGSQAVIVDLESGERAIGGVNPFGQFTMRWKVGRIYLLDFRVKRGSPSSRRDVIEAG